MNRESDKSSTFFCKIQNVIYRTSLVVVLGMFLYVLFFAVWEYGSMPFLGEALSVWQKLLFMVLGLTTAIGFLALVSKKVSGWTQRKLLICMAVIFALWAALQIWFLVTMKIRLRYDALKVLDEAISVCKTGSVSAEHLDGYFARYTNNYPILFLTVAILKAGRAAGLLNDSFHGADLLLGVVNILAVDSAAWLTVRLMRRQFGVRCGLVTLLCITLNPLFVIWVPFYYTNTMSMPFLMLLITLFYELRSGMPKSGAKRAALAFLMGICAVWGFQIRATLILTILALFLEFTLSGHTGKGQGTHKERMAGRLYLACGLLGGILLAFMVYQRAQHRLVPFDYSDSAFPAIHWINMGAGGSGEYNIIDEQNTIRFLTGDEKREANWESYKKRLADLGMAGYAGLMLKKLKLTFADAGAGYRSELGVSDRYGASNLYLVGGKSDLVGYLIQLSYVTGLTCFLICAAILLFRKRRDPQSGIVNIFLWNIAGAFCFHMIWEAGTIYSLTFSMLFSAGAGCAVACVQSAREETKSGGCLIGPVWEKIPPKRLAALFGMQMALWILGLISVCRDVVGKPYVTNDAVVNQYIYEWGDTDELTDGEICEQTFYVNRGFNRMAFWVRNLSGVQNDAYYLIRLFDSMGQSVGEYEIIASVFGDYDIIRVDVEGMEHISKPEICQVRIEKRKGRPECNLVFLSYRTGNYDAYTYGRLLTGEPLWDLCFSAYETKEEPYMTTWQLGAACIVILFLTAAIQICLLRCLLADRSQ